MTACLHPKRLPVESWGNIKLSKCKDCGLVVNDNRYKKINVNKLYGDYYKNEVLFGRFKFGLEYVIRAFRFFRTIKLYMIYPGAKSILDIGCGRGFTLYFLKKFYGYTRTVGTQISYPAFKYAKDELGLEVYNDDLLNLDFNKESFDIVSLWHVLEHINEPEKYITRINELLKPNGLLVIEVPNYDSWTAKWTGPYWLGLDPKYHFSFFTPESIKTFLEQRGFKLVRMHTFSLEYSAFISTQSIVSKLTKTNDLIFNWLQGGKINWVILLHGLLFILFFPMCLVVNMVLFFSKKGEVLTVVAKPMKKKEDYYFDYLVKTDEFPRSVYHQAKHDITRELISELAPGSVILDAGCGVGNVSAPYVGKYRVIGIDEQQSAIDYCSKKYKGEYYKADLNKKIPFKDNYFDLILFHDSIEHFKEPKKALKELARVLKKDKKIVISTINYGNLLWSMLENTWHRIMGGNCRTYDKEVHPTRYTDNLLREHTEGLFREIYLKKKTIGMELFYVGSKL